MLVFLELIVNMNVDNFVIYFDEVLVNIKVVIYMESFVI